MLQSNKEKSLRHVAMVAKLLDLNKLWSCQYGRKNENIDMYDFPKHNCTQEQKLYHSKVTPHFSLLPLVGYRQEYKIAVRMQLK